MRLETGDTFRMHGSTWTFIGLWYREGKWMAEASRPCEGEPDEIHLIRLSEIADWAE